MKMLDRWRYEKYSAPVPYGPDTTYAAGMQFLSGLSVVEDWGCGTTYARRFLTDSRYVGVDGSHSKWTDVVADLRYYESNPDGIFMRHVLEHNYNWQLILKRAVRQFKHRMALIIFTPFGNVTRQIALNSNRVPDISFRKSALTGHFPGLWKEKTFATATQYGTETVFYLFKQGAEDGARCEL